MSFTTVGLCILLWICMAVKGHSFTYSHCEGRYCFLSDGNKFKTIQKARSYCSRRGAWLLELYDEETSDSFSKALKGQLKNIYPKAFPIFLNMEILTDRWIWINQVQSSVTIAHQNQDQSVATLFKNQSQYFIYATKQSSETTDGFICSNINTSCSSNMKLDPRCYYVVRTKTTWYQASNECLRRNSRLATFESMSGRQIKDLFNGEDINYFWVGLLRNALKWSHKNTVVEYSKWKGNYPEINQNIHCPHVNTQQSWDFVCKPESLSVCMKGALSTGGKIGIGIAVVLLCIILTAVVILLVWKFKPKPSKAALPPTQPSPPSNPQRASIYVDDSINENLHASSSSSEADKVVAISTSSSSIPVAETVKIEGDKDHTYQQLLKKFGTQHISSQGASHVANVDHPPPMISAYAGESQYENID